MKLAFPNEQWLGNKRRWRYNRRLQRRNEANTRAGSRFRGPDLVYTTGAPLTVLQGFLPQEW